MTNAPPKLTHALRLKCPHCGNSPLLKQGSWLEFQTGCEPCGYEYEREAGYFSGASWVINYTVAGLTGLSAGALLLWLAPTLSLNMILGIASGLALVVALAFFPVGKALWIWLDHVLHPLGT